MKLLSLSAKSWSVQSSLSPSHRVCTTPGEVFAHYCTFVCLPGSGREGHVEEKGKSGVFCWSCLFLLLFHFLFFLVSAAGGHAEGEARPVDNPLPNRLHEGIQGGNWSDFFLEKVVSSLSSHTISPSPNAGSLSSPSPWVPQRCWQQLPRWPPPGSQAEPQQGGTELVMAGEGTAQARPILRGKREGARGSTALWGQAKGCPPSTAASAPFPTQTAYAQLPLALLSSSVFSLTPISTDFPSYAASSNFPGSLLACFLPCLLACLPACLPTLPRWPPHPLHVPLTSGQELVSTKSAIIAMHTSPAT